MDGISEPGRSFMRYEQINTYNTAMAAGTSVEDTNHMDLGCTIVLYRAGDGFLRPVANCLDICQCYKCIERYMGDKMK